jgi:hypothetical protein
MKAMTFGKGLSAEGHSELTIMSLIKIELISMRRRMVTGFAPKIV